MNNKKNVRVRFQKPVIKQPISEANITRITGFMDPVSFVRLVRAGGLNANPRTPKETSITKAIVDTLKTQPDLFPFKSKGVLFGATDCRDLERERFEVCFHGEPNVVGLLDGGHNTFAIIKHLLVDILGVNVKAKTWDALSDAFESNFTELESVISKMREENNSLIDFLVPVEIIVPTDPENEEQVQNFFDQLVDICQARNTNSQLKSEAIDNKEGIYDFIKESLPKDIAAKIIWKTNEEGSVASADIIAFCWALLENFDKDFQVPLNKIYSSKGECIKQFGLLIKKQDERGSYTYVKETPSSTLEIIDERLKSALRLIHEFPRVFDTVYKLFPQAYNHAGGAFGRIDSVITKKNKPRAIIRTKFYEEECEYSYPEGFIVPLVCGGISALVGTDKNGLYKWKTDPVEFFEDNLDNLLKIYKGLIDMAKWDPQKVGKNTTTYTTIQAVTPGYIK